MKLATAYALAWIATAIGVSIGLYFTKSANCLWAFIFPLCISFTSKEDSKKGD